MLALAPIILVDDILTFQMALIRTCEVVNYDRHLSTLGVRALHPFLYRHVIDTVLSLSHVFLLHLELPRLSNRRPAFPSMQIPLSPNTRLKETEQVAYMYRPASTRTTAREDLPKIKDPEPQLSLIFASPLRCHLTNKIIIHNVLAVGSGHAQMIEGC